MKKLLILVLLISGSLFAQDLTGVAPLSSYKDLLHVSNGNAGLDGTLRLVYDGAGNASKLKLSTGGVSILSGFYLYDTLITATAGQVNFLSDVTDSIQKQLDAKVGLTSISSTITGITYTSGTGVFSLTAGYFITTDSMQTVWDAKTDTTTTNALISDSIAIKVSIADSTTVFATPTQVKGLIADTMAARLPLYLDSVAVNNHIHDSLTANLGVYWDSTTVKTYVLANGGGNPDSALYNASKLMDKGIDTLTIGDGYRLYYDQASDSVKWTGASGSVGNADSLLNLPGSAYMLRSDSTDNTSYTTDKQFKDSLSAIRNTTINGYDLTANISLDKSDIGLSNLVDRPQIKKATSSTVGKIPIWNTTTGDSLVDGYSVGTDGNNIVQLDGSGNLPAVDGSQLTGLPTQFVKKSSAESVNNSTTYQNDDQLTLSVAANKVYLLEMSLIVVANTTSKFKCKFTYPSGTTFIAQSDYTTTASTARDYNSADQTSTDVVTGNPQINGMLRTTAVIITSTTAGSITLQWAQATAQVYNTQVYTGSWLKLTRQ